MDGINHFIPTYPRTSATAWETQTHFILQKRAVVDLNCSNYAHSKKNKTKRKNSCHQTVSKSVFKWEKQNVIAEERSKHGHSGDGSETTPCDAAGYQSRSNNSSASLLTQKTCFSKWRKTEEWFRNRNERVRVRFFFFLIIKTIHRHAQINTDIQRREDVKRFGPI